MDRTVSCQDAVPGEPHADPTGTINHLRISVSDIARARDFYDPLMGRLGYRLVEQDAQRLAWAAWAPHGTLHWFIMSAAKPDSSGTPHDRYSVGFHHLAWNVQSRGVVDEMHEFLVERGTTILDPPAEYDYEPGYYAVFFLDPDGLKLEIMHVDVTGSLEYWHRFLDSSIQE